MDPSLPEHPTKNRPNVDTPADVAKGQQWVESLALANVNDVAKMLRWNEKYGIKFMRLSSEMFPFASHAEYGYTLDFATTALRRVGKVVAELGHRVSTHPGQFTQLGSPRPQVIHSAIRDLKYHCQMLTLLSLPEQQDRDAVMVLHMGGVFGSKYDTLDRFRTNYRALPDNIKERLVLENDDVSWSVHDLLPVCEELTIPLVLDFHHHNIIFDESQVREGTADLVGTLMERILETWRRKGKTPKMHYSEPTSAAITGRQRRKHSARVKTLPPCPPDMDLMIEAKDKEQAVFELMRAFKLPGWRKANAIVPYERDDDRREVPKKAKKQSRKRKDRDAEEEEEVEDTPAKLVPNEEIGMGGALGRVYWPEGMEEWLVPKKREVKKKGVDDEEAVGKE
jgi:UV DNA damage endonuclease